MSNQEPNGWCAWHPEKGFADPNDREENLREVMDYLEPHEHGLTSTALREGWEIKPVMLIDPQELSRLRLIEQGFNKIHRHMLEQADDEALWLDAESVVEHYILQELRKLHQTIEQASDAITEAKPEPKMHTDAFGQPLIRRPNDQDEG